MKIHIELPDVPVEAKKPKEPRPMRGVPSSNDLSPAFERLTEEGGTEAVLVITDGIVGYPVEEPEYSVLWAVFSPAPPEFAWGTVVKFKPKKRN